MRVEDRSDGPVRNDDLTVVLGIRGLDGLDRTLSWNVTQAATDHFGGPAKALFMTSLTVQAGGLSLVRIPFSMHAGETILPDSVTTGPIVDAIDEYTDQYPEWSPFDPNEVKELARHIRDALVKRAENVATQGDP